MGRGTRTTEFLKECMADALIDLMRRKPFEKISAGEIAEAAGVGRATWFRNFSGKNEAITYKLVRLWYRWFEENSASAGAERYTIDNAIDFLSFCREYRGLIEDIYAANLRSTIYEAFYYIMMPQYGANAEECYTSRFFSYGLFGIVDEWVRRGFCETPDELARLFEVMMRRGSIQ